MTRLDQRYGIALFCLILGVSLTFYTGHPASSDEKAILATSASFVLHGRLDMNAAASSDWLLLPLSRLGTFGVDDALYAKKGLTPSLFVTPLVLIGRFVPFLPLRGTGMLLNPIMTAFTALLIYGYAHRLGYSHRVGAIAGFIYGVCTLALPYTATVFGEPLAGFLLIAMLYTADRGQWGISGLWGALLAGVNVVYTPLIGLALLFMNRDSARKTLFPFLIPLIIGGLLLLGYNAVRFGNPFTTGYNFGLGEGFTHPFLRGLYGLTVGGQRGIIWYSPVLLLCIPGWWLFRQRHKRLAWIGLGAVAAQFILFAAWWSWHGGIVWGPRFLLPGIPIAILFLLPVIALTRPIAIFLLIVLSVISLGINLLGSVYSYFPYISYLFRTFEPFGLDGVMADSFFWDIRYSPILGHLALALSGYPSQLTLDLPRILTVIALLGYGGLALWGRQWRVVRMFVPIMIVISLNWVSAASGSPMTAKSAELVTAISPPGVVLVASTLFDDALVDVKNGSQLITLNAPTQPSDERARRLWEFGIRAAKDRPLWLVTWFAPAASANWGERELWGSAYFVTERSAAGHRVLWFEQGESPLWQPHSATYEMGVRLTRYGIASTARGVWLRLEWERLNRLDVPYSWFVHLLTPDGAIYKQQDRQPLGGYAPTDQWGDQPVVDQLFFPVEGIGKGWSVRIGWVHPNTGQPIPVKGEKDPFIVIPIAP
jgi:hypothetical protein